MSVCLLIIAIVFKLRVKYNFDIAFMSFLWRLFERWVILFMKV